MVDVVVVEVVDMDNVWVVIRLAVVDIIPSGNIARPRFGEKRIIDVTDIWCPESHPRQRDELAPGFDAPVRLLYSTLNC